MSEQTVQPSRNANPEHASSGADVSKGSGFRDKVVGLCFLLAIACTTTAWFFLLGWGAWHYLRF
ncbi:hypothetical protein [Bosea sp. BH3]|uniref:hypothetical protein n=1 Tax=Bosea sp. BH3 TaxID=2871701 RepID=UPI0021CB235D|nr:hypothetical protein [Bosea sp. BH3]MCU4181899.1 hypothetical protein [Bosea sp. BH3]